MVVWRLDPDEHSHVRAFRQVRLRSLSSDPAAFGSSHADALLFDDATWQEHLSGYAGSPGTVFAATSDLTDGRTSPATAIDPLIGMTGVGLPVPDDAMIWGVWVAPEGRRHGHAAALVRAAERWALESGSRTATLWVNRTNTAAQTLYQRLGYEFVGPADLPLEVPDACRDEVCMRHRLGPAGPAAGRDTPGREVRER